MELQRCSMEAFSVIGKEGSTMDGEGFVQNLWQEANSNFDEVKPLAKKDDSGNVIGIWGAMSDLTHSFKNWQNNFTEGLYLAGVEVTEDAIAPEGWVKWTIPAYEYIYVENESPTTFPEMVEYLNKNNISLVGAAHDFICPETGKNYIFFPVSRL